MAYRIVDIEANVKLLTVRHQQKISQGFSCTNYMYCLMKKIKVNKISNCLYIINIALIKIILPNVNFK